MVMAIGASWFAYVEYLVLLDPVGPSLAALAIYSVGSLTNFLRSEMERREVKSAFSHYLAPTVIDQLLADPSRLTLSGEKRDTTFLFTDIAGFTSLSEHMEPNTLVSLLNDYLDHTCQIVLRNGGTIDKIVGDALHVMFNAPSDQPDHGARAVTCALELDEFCEQFIVEQKALGVNLGITRIGVNTGATVVGNFGGATRFDYTAHGDAINTAARLESVNRHLGTRICISESTRDLCDHVNFRPVAKLILKGKTDAIQVYEPWTAGDDDDRFNEYTTAYSLLESQPDIAEPQFEKLAEKYPADSLIAFQLERLKGGSQGTTIVMDEK